MRGNGEITKSYIARASKEWKCCWRIKNSTRGGEDCLEN